MGVCQESEKSSRFDFSDAVKYIRDLHGKISKCENALAKTGCTDSIILVDCGNGYTQGFTYEAAEHRLAELQAMKEEIMQRARLCRKDNSHP